ncbi:MAG: LuxR C-terminal-related transcriptional regulator [Anaerolineae bacterium]|nr:LuxR C-terminal-related transcriptional regulator [Anaerolineae bacterium]
MTDPGSEMDLLSTKLHPPLDVGRGVIRAHLLDRLDAALARRLTLVCAPAGYGKTTLLAQWVRRCQVPVGWVTLDSSDSDLSQFMRYFQAALRSVDPEVGRTTTEAFQALRPASGAGIWAPLVNAIAASGRPFVVVLDDYHEVVEPAVHQAVEYLVEHIPGTLHLIIASRADPPLALARLRARGHLTELRLHDLRFTAEEIADFLSNVMGLDLSVQDVAALEARTEGWIASLQMAALSLQMHSPDRAARSEFVRAFTGSHRFILDYLVEEVMAYQPPDLQTFLVRTSILERLTASLCDALAGEVQDLQAELPGTFQVASPTLVGSQSILAYLESANLFTVPLDDQRQWYRYHRLFSDLLRKRLEQELPDLVPVLHRRASRWYEDQGQPKSAVDHALAARDYERAVALIGSSVEAVLMRSEVRTFLTWMERLPEEHAHARPELRFYHAWSLLMSGAPQAVVEQRLQDLAQMQGTTSDGRSMAGRLAALHAYLFFFQADIQRAEEACVKALADLPQEECFLRNVVSWVLSMVRLSAGGDRDGKEALDRIIRLSQETGSPLIAVASLSHQARLQMRQGRLQLARETLEHAVELATDREGGRLPIASEALIVLGDLEREWNHLHRAAEVLTESIELAQQWNELAAFDAYYPLMKVRLAQGDLPGARAAVEKATWLARRSEMTDVDDYLADLQQAAFDLTQGNDAGFLRWAARRGLVSGDAAAGPSGERSDYIDAHLRKYENLLLARAMILHGQAGPALELLEALLKQARELERTDLIIETQILRALAFQAACCDGPAGAALAEALALAEPGGYVRIFLDEGEPMARLLRCVERHEPACAYAARLLAAYGEPVFPVEPCVVGAAALPGGEPLSERELDVLRLLARGLSDTEIAEALVVAVSTVRSHCKSIYGKLDVHRRWDAVDQAQQLGLI